MFGMKEVPKPNKRFYIALASVLIVIFAVSAVLLLVSPDAGKTSLKMDRAACESADGAWNECGSPCTGAPQGTMCIMVCREQCEWFASSADAARANSALSSQTGFGCLTQDNGILMCWLAA